MFNYTTPQGNLEGEEECEEELVTLIQAPCRVLEYFKGKAFNYTEYAFACNWRPVRPLVRERLMHECTECKILRTFSWRGRTDQGTGAERSGT